MHLKEFLSRVLPTDGYKCWVEITPRKRVIQGFVTTTDELAEKLLEIDSRGRDAYFGCASFKTPDNRQGANTLAAKAFWLDIDAGEGKPYATADDAIQACDAFCNRHSLPLPGIVRSGGGCHAYWILSNSIDRETWLANAAHLKLLTNASGFFCDPSRTADIASILRAPGTKNYKLSVPRPVEIDSDDGWEPGNFLGLLQGITPLSPLQTGSLAINSQGGITGLPSNVDLLAGTSKAFDSTKGVEAGRRGSTQLKYAGELVAKGHPEEEVIRLCLEWNQLCTPPQDDKEVVRVVRSAFTMHAQKHPPVLAPEELPTLPELPHNFKWGPQQQLLIKVKVAQDDGSEKEELKVVSPYPVYLVSIMNNEGGARTNSFLFRQWSAVDGWNDFSMSSEQINSSDWYAQWEKNGGSIHAGMDKYFKIYIREAIIMLRAQGETTRYSQFGWKENDNAFLVGDVLLRNSQPSRAHGTDKLANLMRGMALPKEGSLEEWTATADQFFAPGMEAHGFALLCGFAAPLIHFCAGMGDGGAVLSLMSEGSGNGKTPITEAISSIWGDLSSTIMSASSTENSLMESVVRHCHLPVIREEMSKGDPVIVAENIKRFTVGIDRERLNKDGAAKGISERYQTLLICVSNLSLYETVAMADQAASRRIFEIDVKRPDSEIFDNLGGLTREMMRCRAYAGRRYAQLLTAPGYRQYLIEHLTGTSKDKAGSVIMKYRGVLETSAEHRFIVWLLAAAEVAGRIVVNDGILHFDVDRIMNWAKDQAYARVHAKDADTAEGKLQRFLGENVGGILVVADAFTPGKPLLVHTEPKYALVGRAEMKSKLLYISSDAMRRWCTKNKYPFLGLGRHLAEQGIILERSKQITLGAGTMIPSARTYCWEIDLDHPSMSGTLQQVASNVIPITA